MSESTKTYTLSEATAELARRECAAHGHDFDIISTGAGEPIKLRCGRCGRSWGVSP
jgi:hypothetical protein